MEDVDYKKLYEELLEHTVAREGPLLERLNRQEAELRKLHALLDEGQALALLREKEELIAKLQAMLDKRKHFESHDVVHKTLNRLLPMCRLDPERVAARLNQEWLGAPLAECERDAIVLVVPWLVRYQAALEALLPPPEPQGDQIAAARYRRAVRVQ